MQVKILTDHQKLSFHIAEIMVNLIQNKTDCLICLAAGDTPKLMLHYFVQLVKQKKTDLSRVHFVGLDEWVNVSPATPGSCQHFFRHQLIDPLNLKENQVHFFDAMSDDLKNECQQMDQLILKRGGFDLMLVGIGMNGHIGFNEPGVSPHLYSHVIDLDETTRNVGQKYFKQATELNKGITLGLRHLLEAKKVILMASGTKKAEIIRKTLLEGISADIPATYIRSHPNGWIYLDEDAASLLSGIL
jgi:glucosamine-6-phosphate isomerase